MYVCASYMTCKSCGWTHEDGFRRVLGVPERTSGACARGRVHEPMTSRPTWCPRACVSRPELEPQYTHVQIYAYMYICIHIYIYIYIYICTYICIQSKQMRRPQYFWRRFWRRSISTTDFDWRRSTSSTSLILWRRVHRRGLEQRHSSIIVSDFAGRLFFVLTLFKDTYRRLRNISIFQEMFRKCRYVFKKNCVSNVQRLVFNIIISMYCLQILRPKYWGRRICLHCIQSKQMHRPQYFGRAFLERSIRRTDLIDVLGRLVHPYISEDTYSDVVWNNAFFHYRSRRRLASVFRSYFFEDTYRRLRNIPIFRGVFRKRQYVFPPSKVPIRRPTAYL